MKRILFFISSLAGGGAEKILVNTANSLIATGKYSIKILALFDGGVNKKYLVDKIEYTAVFRRKFRGNIHLLKLFSPEFLYAKLIGSENYDIIVSFFQSPTTRIVAAGKNILGTKSTSFVQWIHSVFYNEKELTCCYRSRREFNRLQKNYDATVFVSRSAKDAYLSLFPDLTQNNEVLYNLIETDEILKLADEEIDDYLFDINRFNLVSVGRLVPVKAFDRLIDIVQRLTVDDGLDVSLTLLGDGELKKALENKIRKYNLSDRVSLLGYRDNPYKYVKASNLFVCSSLKEGMSTAVSEALIVGTPVVTTACSGMEELLGRNEFGIITNNDTESLYQGVKKVVSNKILYTYLCKKTKERLDFFSKAKRVETLEVFLDSFY